MPEVRLRKARLLILIGFLVTTSCIANAMLKGKFINGTMTWDGITRYYRVYVPLNLPPNPALVMMLHGASLSTTPPTTKSFGWYSLADQYHFIEVQPAATLNTATGAWNWNAYYVDKAFQNSPGPDDSGLLRQLIVNLTAEYALDPKRIYIAGMSSGAEMAQRVGVEISDLVAAIIPASGQISAVPALPIVLPGPPVSPVSVQEWHGTLDTTLPPCKNGTTKYSGVKFWLATVISRLIIGLSSMLACNSQTTCPYAPAVHPILALRATMLQSALVVWKCSSYGKRAWLIPG
jgi:poly(hydroxyalkanoate) depolymerase family esterase